jgi:UPF0755 protein
VNPTGGPDRRGRHSSADDGAAGAFGSRPFDPRAYEAGAPGHEAPRYEPSRYEPSRFAVPPRIERPAPRRAELPRHSFEGAEHPTGAFQRSRVLDRYPDETGPLVEPMMARHSGDDRPAPQHFSDTEHPSAPLPPRPAGVWDKLQARQHGSTDDSATVASPLFPGDAPEHDEDLADSDDDTGAWHDRTGGLEVIGAHVEETGRRGRFRRHRRDEHDPLADVLDEDHHVDDDEIPISPYDPHGGGGRRRRRPWAVLVSLLVLAGLVFGIVVGGQKLLALINPDSSDYTGQGSGEVQIRVANGDTLSDIARTLVDAGVIASVGPFVDAAEGHPDATGIQPGVYALREKMSGQAALDLMLDPVARLVSRVTIPEGLTAAATLDRLAEETGVPREDLEAATADPAALGLPAWTNGSVEGFLFPATYDFEPDTSPAEMVRAMVARANQAFTDLQIPAEQLQEVLTEASIVQAEAASPEDMAKVARVLENRIAIDMPLQLDTTVNYANGKSGITTTPEDRANPSPYNTYMHAGLPPGPISNPGEEALSAALSPADGNWLFFVVVNPDTGETRFAATAEEHQQNVLLFQQWLRENPGG